MNLAVALRDQMSSGIDEVIGSSDKEEITAEDLLSLSQFPLRLLEVEVNVQSLDETGEGVRVLVALLANDTDQVLELLLVDHGVLVGARSVGDDGGGQVSEDPGARCLDGVDVGGGEEEVCKDVTGGIMVEEREETPVDQPCAAGELGKRVVEESSVDGLLDLGDFLHGALPVGSQDLRSKLTPRGGSDLVVICR